MAAPINQSRFFCSVLTAAACFALGGCDEPSGPRAYEAPVEERPAALAERERAVGGSAAPRGSTAPDAPASASAAASAESLSWSLPEGWSEQPSDSPMRHATLYSGDPAAADTLSVTVSRFSGNIGGLAANVNRWRRQVGLEPVGPEQVMQDVRPIEDGDVPCLMIDLTGEAVAGDTSGGGMPGMPAPAGPGEGPVRLIVAWFSDGSHHWFFKATASPDVMEQHAEAFAQLIASVRPQENTTENASENASDKSDSEASGQVPGEPTDLHPRLPSEEAAPEVPASSPEAGDA